jgi:hypothetical protein
MATYLSINFFNNRRGQDKIRKYSYTSMVTALSGVNKGYP